MTVLVRIAATGMDQAAYDQASPGLHDLVKKQPGFIIHVAYLTPGGFAVGEVWDSQAQQESWSTTTSNQIYRLRSWMPCQRSTSSFTPWWSRSSTTRRDRGPPPLDVR